MKKIISISFVLLPCFAFAQFSKGQVYLGGTISASLFNSNTPATPNSTLSNAKQSGFSLSPVFGYFLNPKIAVGGGIGYSNYTFENDYTYQYYDANNNIVYAPGFFKSKSNSVFVNTFLRYYIPISSSFYLAAQGRFNFTRSNAENNQTVVGYPENITKTPSYSLGLSINPALVFFPSPKWSLEASVGSIGYNYSRDLPNTYSSNSFSLGLGSFSFGLAYYFKKKSK